MALTERILKEKGLSAVFEEAGQQERYLVAKVSSPKQRYEIYVYLDEAGLMIGREWLICERPDFKSADELIHAFGQILSEKIR